MLGTPAERRKVYLACKAIFTGPHATIRKKRTIQRRLSAHKQSLSSLIPGFDTNRVADVARGLLEKRVFQSDAKAKLEFPDLFQKSSLRDIQHDASEHEAAKSAAEAIAAYEREEKKTVNVGEDAQAPVIAIEPETETSREGVNAPKSLQKDLIPGSEPPSLFPSYFPYKSQHQVLSTVQRLLEEACYDFTKKYFPEEVENNEWDCAAAVELTKWSRLLSSWKSRLPEGSLELADKNLNTLLLSVCQVRHTAVHRQPTTARGVSAMIKSAMELTEALQDPLRTSQLEDLHIDIQNNIKAMELNKNVLEGQLHRELKMIAAQRASLDRRERLFRSKILNSDRENKSLMGFLIEESMERIFTGDRPVQQLSENAAEEADEGEEAEGPEEEEDGEEDELIESDRPNIATRVAARVASANKFRARREPVSDDATESEELPTADEDGKAAETKDLESVNESEQTAAHENKEDDEEPESAATDESEREKAPGFFSGNTAGPIESTAVDQKTGEEDTTLKVDTVDVDETTDEKATKEGENPEEASLTEDKTDSPEKAFETAAAEEAKEEEEEKEEPPVKPSKKERKKLQKRAALAASNETKSADDGKKDESPPAVESSDVPSETSEAKQEETQKEEEPTKPAADESSELTTAEEPKHEETKEDDAPTEPQQQQDSTKGGTASSTKESSEAEAKPDRIL